MGRLIFAVFVMMLCAAPGAYADDIGRAQEEFRNHQAFQQGSMDSNADGTVTKEEFVAYHSRTFKLADTDKDGKISSKEYQLRKESLNLKIQDMAMAQLQIIQDQVREQRVLAEAEAAAQAAAIQPAAGAEEAAQPAAANIEGVEAESVEEVTPFPGLENPQDLDPRRHGLKSFQSEP